MEAALIRRRIRFIYPFLATLLLVHCYMAYTQPPGLNAAGQNTARTASAEHPVISGIASTQETSYCNSVFTGDDYPKNNPVKDSPFRPFITPQDLRITSLAALLSEPEDAYQMAVQWIYVSDEELNHTADRWLVPYEFLVNTPNYPDNPLPGVEVSDCEEKANTLVSLMRARAVAPEEVRVVLGKVTFDDVETGHAWVELLMDGQWLALDPSWGPYWDSEIGKLVQRRGLPFNFYASHTYPVLQVWDYYNDIYYLDPRDGSGNAPASWTE